MTTLARSRARWMRRGSVEVAIGVGALLLAAYLLLSPQGHPGPAVLSGSTMGTTYRVALAAPLSGDMREAMSRLVDARLTRINTLMSTYDPTSTLSRFNTSSSTEWFAVDRELVAVVAAAHHVSTRSAGRFDVTAGPLVNLWGFGPDAAPTATPTQAMVDAAAERVGHEMLAWRTDPPSLRKARSDLYVDLSAIAKGYAVDQIAAMLKEHGYRDFLVEVGGELRAAGHSPDGNPWQVGIEQPNPAGRIVEFVHTLQTEAMATSGDYRNVIQLEGETLAHGIDVRSGRPLRHAALSVSVFHPRCMLADAWATALMVTPLDEAKQLADTRFLEALIIYREGDQYVHWKSAALRARGS